VTLISILQDDSFALFNSLYCSAVSTASALTAWIWSSWNGSASSPAAAPGTQLSPSHGKWCKHPKGPQVSRGRAAHLFRHSLHTRTTWLSTCVVPTDKTTVSVLLHKKGEQWPVTGPLLERTAAVSQQCCECGTLVCGASEDRVLLFSLPVATGLVSFTFPQHSLFLTLHHECHNFIPQATAGLW
jgi:hypothetical protein